MSQMTRSVVFIDANVSDLDHLLNGVLPGVRVKLLDAKANNIDQITDYLKTHPAHVVHIVSHGAPGCLFLGNNQLDLNNLEAHATALASWFTPGQNPSLLLYGCNVAAGDAGAEFITKLHQFTGAAIGASTHKVGSSTQGGNWHLDAHLAQPSSETAFTAATLASYSGVFPVTVSGLDNFTFTEGTGPIVIDNSITFSSTVATYNDGNLRFKITNSSTADQLALTSSATPNAVGAISVVGTDVYLGNGSGRDRIGSIDATLNGTNGKELLINFASPLANAGFETGSLTGWTAFNQNYNTVQNLNGQSIPYVFGGTNGTGSIILGSGPSATFNVVVQSSVKSTGTYALQLTSNGGISGPSGNDQPTGNGSLHGPYVRSSTFQAFAGDSITLDWSAQNGSDAYEVFGFLVGAGGDNTFGTGDDSRTQLFSQRGDIQAFKEASAIIGTAGSYQFEFVSGSYDKTGGLALGASLYIDNVRLVSATSVTNSVVATIAQQITFNNTSTAPDTTTRTLQVTAVNANNESGSASSSGTITNVNNPPTGSVTITGTVQQGSTLTANTAALVDGDGLGAFSYQWQESTDGTTWTNISGATASTFALGQNQVNKFVRVNASYTDGGSTAESVNSNATGTKVANVNDPPTGSVTITGTPTQGQTLTAANTLADVDGLGAITYTWFANGTSTGQTGSSYTLTQADVGKVMTVRASYTDGDGNAESVTSSGTSAIANVNDPPTGTVTISGTAKEGETLTVSSTLADLDGLGTITYNWLADGSSTGVTGLTYNLTSADVGKVFTVVASYTDGGSANESVTSDPTSAVILANNPPTGGVTITGDVTIGSTLTADTSSLVDPDGLGTLGYQWEISTDGGSWSTIDGATSSTYTLLPEDVNKRVRVVVSYEDGGGASESVTSGATGDVALATPPGARSATVNGEVFLGGNFIELGISTLGDFGSTESRPEGFFGTDARDNIGMSADFDGFGFGNDFRTDYFLPGTPEERWVLGYKVGETTVTGSNSALNNFSGEGPEITVSSVVDTSSGDTLSALISGSLNEALKVDQVVRYGVNDKYFATIITLTNVTEGALDSVRYMRSFDPDNTVDVGGEFDTINTVIATIAADGVAAVEAKTLGAGDPIFNATGLSAPVVLFSADPRAKASYFGFANTDPYASAAYDTPPEKGVSVTDDIGITMTFDVGTLAAGASTSFVYYTSLDGRSFDDILNDGFPPTGVATIDGDLTQGQILTANTSGIGDFDGLPDPSTFTYQWQESIDGINWVDIDGATDSSFSLRNDQVGKYLRYTVSYVDGKGTPESLTGVSTTTTVAQFDASNDFNDDGSVDIFWQHQLSDEAVFWLMDNVELQSGAFLLEDSSVIANWEIKAVGDLNGDDNPDLIWQHKFSNQTALWTMDGQSIASGDLLPDVGPDWKVVESSDFNNDGNDDILWRHVSAGQLAVWFMDGNTRLDGVIADTPLLTDPTWYIGAAGDFTNDGNTEILWRNSNSGENAFWFMNGTEFVRGELTTPFADNTWSIQGAADFTQDGNLDILWENIGAGQNAVWVMEGTTRLDGILLPSVDLGWVSIV